MGYQTADIIAYPIVELSTCLSVSCHLYLTGKACKNARHSSPFHTGHMCVPLLTPPAQPSFGCRLPPPPARSIARVSEHATTCLHKVRVRQTDRDRERATVLSRMSPSLPPSSIYDSVREN